MARAAAQVVALVTVMPQSANVTLGTSLALPLTNPANQSQILDNQTPFYPEAIQNLADRIKSRSRKASISTQITHAPGIAKLQQNMAKPQQPSSSPSKTVRRSLKRPSQDEGDQRPARVRKVSQDKGAKKPKTAKNKALTPRADEVSQRPSRARKVSQEKEATEPNPAESTAPNPSQDEVPAQRHKTPEDEEATKPDIAESTASTASQDGNGQRAAQHHETPKKEQATEPKASENTTPALIQDEISQGPAQRHETPKDEQVTEPKAAENTAPAPIQDEVIRAPARHHETSTDEKATKPKIAESTACAPQITAPQETRPVNDTAANLAFANQVIKALEIRHKPRVTRFGDRQNRTILALLKSATPASREEMLFLKGTEAAQFLAPGIFHNGPILTEGQQPMPLQRIEDFLGEFYDDDGKVFIQDPSVQFSGKHNFVREVTIGAVKKRILGGKSKGRPWNCLELATHVEDGLRPAFLAGEDSRLLTKVKLESAGETASRRSYPQGYKEVEKWALLAEAGALTEPHQDSHGYSTYITVNQGNIGFGWLSFPTDEERAAWNKDQSSGVAGDRFRYIVMKPGQTVFFPAGTVHFVFRLPATGAHTLAFGGHVLRCSNILHWIKTLIEEKASPDVTNEDLTSSAPGYLNRVEKFVRHAQKNGTTEKWGGPEAVEEFLRLKEGFMAS
jgi:hypothetical protein